VRTGCLQDRPGNLRNMPTAPARRPARRPL